jgi:hypothetical protein
LGCATSAGSCSGCIRGCPINVGSRFASLLIPSGGLVPSGGLEARSGSSAMVAPGGVSKN